MNSYILPAWFPFASNYSASICMMLMLSCSSSPMCAQIQPVIDVPPAAISSGFIIPSGTRLNLMDSGVLPAPVVASEGAELYLFGGHVGSGFIAEEGSHVTIVGGQLGDGPVRFSSEEITFQRGSTLTMSGGVIASDVNFRGDVAISGGALGDRIAAHQLVSISGGEFYLNGEPFIEDQLVLENSSTFSAVLTDGTPLVLSEHVPYAGRPFHSIGQIHLERTSLPAIGPQQISVVDQSAPRSIRNEQHVIVGDGGELPDYFRAGRGSELTILPGGLVGEGLQTIGGTVEVAGGELLGPAYFFEDSTVNVRDGSVGFGLSNGLFAFDGAKVHISGGQVSSIWAVTGSEVTIAGGVVRNVTTREGSRVELRGGEFAVNGNPINDNLLSLDLSESRILTGVLEDGSPIFLRGWEDDTLYLVAREPAGIKQETLTTSLDGVPAGVRNGQTLIVDSPASENILAIDGARVEILPNAVLAALDAVGANIRLAGGRIEGRFEANKGTKVNITDVSSSGPSGLFEGVGLNAREGAVVQMSGGTIAENRFRGDGLPISIHRGGSIQFVGTDFEVNGTPVEAPTGESKEISVRGGDSVLTGRLASGEQFRLSMSYECVIGCFGISPDASVSVTLLDPMAGDVNEDGLVDAADIDFLSEAILAGNQLPIFDLNLDHIVDDFDRTVLIQGLLTPEPSGSFMLGWLTVLYVLITRRRHSSFRRGPHCSRRSPARERVRTKSHRSSSMRGAVRRISSVCNVAWLYVVTSSMSLSAQTWRDSSDLVYHDGEGNSLPYRLFLPPGHDDPSADLPLVVYLHRAAHVGTDNQVHVSNHIAGLIQATQGPEFKSVLLAPQAPTAWWFDSVLPLTTGLLDEVEQTQNIDSSRIYLTGTSMGGFGVTDLVSRFPGRFAAAVPLSAGILSPDELIDQPESPPLADVEALAKTPYWVFHATQDTTTNVEWSRELVSTIESAGGVSRYTELPGGADHSSIWSGIYFDRNNELYPWMFSQSLSVPEPATKSMWALGLVSLLLGARRKSTRKACPAMVLPSFFAFL